MENFELYKAFRNLQNYKGNLIEFRKSGKLFYIHHNFGILRRNVGDKKTGEVLQFHRIWGGCLRKFLFTTTFEKETY